MKNPRFPAACYAFLIVLLLSVLPGPVLAAEKLLVATVTAGEEIAILAPNSGEVLPFTVKAGDSAAAGDTLFYIKPHEKYAEVDGTVAALHVRGGGSASGAVDRYGAVLQIEHENRYELKVSMATGYNSAENRDLWVGTPVFLRAVNGRAFGLGTIISVAGSSFTVSVESGDLQFNEEVRVYRSEDHNAKALLGRAKPSLVPPHRVTASGTVLFLHVKHGDKVRQGDLLFTYVPDSLSPSQRAAAGAAKAEEPLVIGSVAVAPGASVQQGQVLARAYRLSSMRLSAQAEEGDIATLLPGTPAVVFFEELGLDPVPALVSGVSALGTGDEVARYDVTFAFEPPEEVRLGMHATVQVP